MIGAGGLEGRRVFCAYELNAVLRAEPPFAGRIIIPRDAVFDMTSFTSLGPLPLRSNVQVVGERGFLGSRPLLYTSDQRENGTTFHLFEVMGNDVRVEGLHLRGPWPAKDHKKHVSKRWPYIHAILVNEDAEQELSGRRIVIADNEFEQWSGAGVRVIGSHRATLAEWRRHGTNSAEPWKHLNAGDAGLVRVERNYMHHNVMDGGGYGVTVDGGAYVTIEGNVFDFNRHAVAASGDAHSGYIARFNYVLQGGYMQDNPNKPDFYNQHFDVHGDGGDGYGGWAGTYFAITHNTIRGEQKYGVPGARATRPVFSLRGRAAQVAFFNDNVAVHDDLDAAVSLKKSKYSLGIGESHTKFNFRATRNRFDTDYSAEIAAGDFDGDGRTDVFIANGTAWFYSRAGVRPWEFLTGSGRRTRELAFADIDNDAVTDVLWRDSSGMLGYSKSGRAGFASLTRVPVPVSDLRFGDFDGDESTDIFYTRAGQWRLWSGRMRTWTLGASSSFPISELLFGQFDDIAGTDVVAPTGGWSYSSGAVKPWTRMNGKLVNSFAKAVAADFDGNGKTDIAIDEGQRWRYSPDGRLPLAVLLPKLGGPRPVAPLKKVLIGRFQGPGPPAQVVTFSGERLVHWDAQRCCFSRLSSQNMR